MCTNIEYYEHGDFLMTNNRIAFIFDREGKNGEAHHLFCVDMDQRIDGNLQKCGVGEKYCGHLKNTVLADNEATEAIVKGLKKISKYWDENKKRIENIGVYKEGDFLKTFSNNLFILKKINKYEVYDHAFLIDNSLMPGESRCCYTEDIAGYCTLEEEIKIIDALRKDNKQWNAKTKRIETIPVYKNGDFLKTKTGNLFILKEIKKVSYEKEYSAFCHFFTSISSNYREYGLNKNGVCFEKGIDGYCTPEEKQKILDDLAKDSKHWNAEKKCIEDIPVYKNGDFVVSELGSILIFKEADGDRIFDHACLTDCDKLFIDIFGGYDGVKRYATTEEKQRMIDALAEQGKCWNDDKKCVENIPQPKFKVGDKVRIKDGISSKTHRSIRPHFTSTMNEFIGKELTVKEYTSIGWIVFYEDDYGYQFDENWLEPWIEDISQHKFKTGDKVKIKNEISSETHKDISSCFENFLNQYVGKVMTVKKYITTDIGEYVTMVEGKKRENHFGFPEDWLELWDDKSDCIFKKGDRVIFSKDFSDRIRDEYSHFANHVKKYIGKPLTVSNVCNNRCVWIKGEKLHGFSKDCLELWSDEPKVGDWVIAWSDGEIRDAIASVITQIDNDDNTYFVGGFWFENVIKWDDIKKHIEKIQKE